MTSKKLTSSVKGLSINAFKLLVSAKSFGTRLVHLLTNDMETDAEDIVAIYKKRWEIEMLFKQLKQDFSFRYFYGESANAIKIQVRVTLIVNLLLMVIQRRVKRT